MTQIRNLHTYGDRQYEFLDNIQQRRLEQKFLYLAENANKFYDALNFKGNHLSPVSAEQLAAFIRPHLDPSKKINFIALGCGNGKKEADMVKLLSDDFDVSFTGVDFSYSMLEMAKETLAEYGFPFELLCTDFSSHAFRQEINSMKSPDEQRVFIFLGYTIGNVSQTKIVDTLYNVVDQKDLIWIDAVTRVSTSKESNLAIFEKYADRLNNEKKMSFYFSPLADLDIPYDSGNMVIQSTENKSAGLLNFTYSFEFTQPVTATYRGDKIHMLPGQRLDLLTIRVYHPPTFINFFENHDFNCLANQVVDHDGQFLFQKK